MKYVDQTVSQRRHIFDMGLVRSGFQPDRISQLGRKRIILGADLVEHQYGVIKRGVSRPIERLGVLYKEHPLVSWGASFRTRHFQRYDFLNEWNNFGYGRIEVDSDSPFSCNTMCIVGDGAEVIAEVVDVTTGEKICDYAAVIRSGDSIVLWFNRDAGPVDGYDWVVIENFLSKYHNEIYGGYPFVSEVPYACEGAVTMRIDCDEAIGSGRALHRLYRAYDMPFSMAIKTDQTISENDRLLISEVLIGGGAVVGHSHTHTPDWGGSAQAASWEVVNSRKVLGELGVLGINDDYVVSPFHQNSTESIVGLCAAGVRGFVGGIICNDPQFLLARAGVVPFVKGIISHSQQCMFHGDTYHRDGNSIEGYMSAFRQALETNTFFGYLDHPFSNYLYGWSSEEERLGAHEEFLKFMDEFPNIWRANLVDALRFLEMKSTVKIVMNGDGFAATLPLNDRFLGLPSVAVVYGDKQYELKMGDTVVF